MSTRGRIGVLRPDGRVESIYNHFDSYPEHLGEVLGKEFLEPSLVDELIALGDRDALYPKDYVNWKGEKKPDFRDKSYLYSDDRHKFHSRFNANEDEYWNNDDDWDIDYKYLYVPTKDGGEWFRNGKRTPFATYKNPVDLANALKPQPLKISNPQAAITGGEGSIVKK